MGSGISPAPLHDASAGLLPPLGTQNWAVEGDEVCDSDSANGGYVYQERESHGWSYRKLLREVGTGEFKLTDMDCDTGNPAEVGEYELADWAYAQLLMKLDHQGFERLSAGLRQNVSEFYRGLDVPPPTKRQMKAWREALQELQKIHANPPARVESDARPRPQLSAPKAGTDVWK